MTVTPRDIAGLLFAAFGLGAVGGVLLVLAATRGQKPVPARNEEDELKWQGKLRAYERKLGGEPIGPG